MIATSALRITCVTLLSSPALDMDVTFVVMRLG